MTAPDLVAQRQKFPLRPSGRPHMTCHYILGKIPSHHPEHRRNPPFLTDWLKGEC